MPIDLPPNTHSPIQKPAGWRPRPLYGRTHHEITKKRSWGHKIARGLLILGICVLAGVGASTLITLMGLGVLLDRLDRIDTLAADPLPDKMTLTLTLDSDPDEQDRRRRLTRLFEHTPNLSALRAALDEAGQDKRVSTLLVRLNNPGLSLASAQELRTAIQKFRSTGKQAHIFTTSFGDLGGNMSDYYFAAAFDKIWMQPTGMVGITGLHMESPYFGALLERLGVSYQVVAREEYKSAMESMILRQMSPAAREMMNALMDDIFDQIIQDIAKDRKLTPAQIRTLIDTAPIRDRIAVKSGLVDHLGYRDEVLAQAPKDGALVALEDYGAQIATEKALDNKNTKRPQIALIEGHGVIMEGADGRATAFGQGMEIEEIADAMESAMDDPQIRAIILRLNTPGGSPAASEYLRRTIIRAKNAGKPVIIAMGAVAASGGYWIASAGTKIVAQPATMTGSIGVISGKPTVARLSDKYQIGWTSISRGANADLGTIIRPYTPRERLEMEGLIDDSYQNFLDRVAEGRKMDKAAVRALAKGRVWTGRQAAQNGLVDALGGVDVAVTEARKAIGLDDKARIEVIAYPGEERGLRSLIETVKSLGVLAILPMLTEAFQAELQHILASSSGIQARLDLPGEIR